MIPNPHVESNRKILLIIKIIIPYCFGLIIDQMNPTTEKNIATNPQLTKFIPEKTASNAPKNIAKIPTIPPINIPIRPNQNGRLSTALDSLYS